ncbi:BhlA/UviB family holin-like peptide [Lentibacillus amyloliquefaciens]|uniref:Holin n=1 Tax=Lentibacillus amyloliquefaciens TaxID=1472767 RepID=A0A0U3NM15_9BACI|nr:BhlA/UviB family holin-like peptide [Lentibacillus amyloliquefaciens]ALX47851.1 holin [Lentibacillus amyloliquefaciens]
MDLSQIPIDMIVQQGIFAVLFVWLFIATRKESKEREDRLNQQIDNQNRVQGKIVQTLERLETKISHITNKGSDK